MSQRQQLSLGSTIAIGIASMIGAGVFVVFREATALAGNYLWWALFLAATVASLNAASVYQLAAVNDRAGGVYAYSRVYLNDFWSFISGFSFVFGKIGSIAAIALVFAEYIAPASKSLTASIAIGLLTLINVMGINRTALVATILASITTLYFTIAATFGIRFALIHSATASNPNPNPLVLSVPGQLGGILPAAAVLFFAFAGYARVATLGSEVRNAKRNIPRAILLSLGFVLVLYLALAISLVLNFGGFLPKLKAPFLSLFQVAVPWMPDWVTIFVAAAASLGSMLALLAGVSRTAATMAEDHELPAVFERRNRFGSPWVAETVIAVGSILVLQVGSLTWVIGFSSLSVLLYYAIGHASALRQPSSERQVARVFSWVGLVLCVLLLIAVPGPAVWVSAIILVAVSVLRRVARRGLVG